jgi:hypothetical protein
LISIPLCTDILLGIPLYSLFTAVDMEIDFGTTYALEITITSTGITNLGYVNEDSIPFDGGVSGATITYNAGLLTIMGLGTVASGKTVTTYIPWDSSWATAGHTYTNIATRLYYTVSTNAEQYVLYSNTGSWKASSAAVTLDVTTTATNFNLDTSLTLTGSDYALGGGSSSAGDYIGFSFP